MRWRCLLPIDWFLQPVKKPVSECLQVIAMVCITEIPVIREIFKNGTYAYRYFLLIECN